MSGKKILLILVLCCCAALNAESDSDNLLLDLKVVDGKITAAPAKMVKNKVAVNHKENAVALNIGDEKNQYLRVYSKTIRNNGKPLPRSFTVEAWFKPDDIIKPQQLVHKLVWWSKSGYGDGAFSLGIKGGKAYVSVWTFNKKLKKGRKLIICKGGKLVLDSWNFIAAVFDGSKLSLFVNGKKCAEKAIPEGIFPYSKYDRLGSFIIGGGCYTGRSVFSGLIGRIRVRGKVCNDFFFDQDAKKKIEASLKKLNDDSSLFDFNGSMCRMGLRPGSYNTNLNSAVVVAPSGAESLELARRLAEKLGIPAVKAIDTVTARCQGLKPEYLDKNLILLGNINNNEAIIPLYAKFLSWADAAYPGKDGYALRTIRNPYGTFKNNILLAASNHAGLEKAVAAFLKAPQLNAASKTCDYLFDIKPVFPEKTKKEIAKLRSKIASFVKKGAVDKVGRQIGQFATAYYLTGDKRFQQALKAYAGAISKKTYPAFVVGHYYWENFVRALELITNTNTLDTQTVRKLDINLFLSLFKMRKDFGIRRYQQAPGGRHQLPPSCAYMMFCDLLRRNLSKDASSNIRNFVDANYLAVSKHFQYLSQCTFSGSDDSSSTATNMTSLMQAAFILGDMTLFKNGLAREGAKKMICITDNWGCGAGTGTYEDAYEDGMTKKNYINGGPLCYAAFYYQDSGLKWVKQNVRGMDFNSWFARTWFGLHKYATGDYLKAVKPASKYMSTFCRPRPITLNKYKAADGFSKDKLFDKAVIRTGAARQDAYLCFQGNGSGKEGSWSSASDTLVLLRYADKGVLWLANNTQLNGAAWRNSFIVSDGSTSSKAGYPFARLNFLGKVNGYDAFSASVRDVRNGVWTRRAVYLGNGKLFIADTFQAGKNGEYSFLQTFKTPVPAKLQGNKVTALKSGLRMTVTGTGKGIMSIDNGIRRMEPQQFWYFRKSYDRKMKAGEKVTLATIFNISVFANKNIVSVTEASPESFYISDNGKFIKISFNESKLSINKVSVCPVSTSPLSKQPQQTRGMKKFAEIKNNFALAPEVVRGWKLLAPKLKQAHVIDDNIVKRWDAGCGYDGKAPLLIDLMNNTQCGGLEILTKTYKHSGEPKKSKDIAVIVEFSESPDFKSSEKFKVAMKHNPDMRELYKMAAWQVRRYTGKFAPAKMRYLRISGLPSRIAELRIYSGRQVSAEIKKMKVCDLDGDGKLELLVETFDRRITAFNQQGKELFSIKVPFEIIDFAAADLDGDTKAEIIFPCFDLRLYKYNWQGKQIKVSGPLFQHPYTINVLTDKNTGTKKLAITYYYHHQFFDYNLNPLFKPKGFGAMWTENAQPMDINGDGVEDLVMSDIYARAYTVDGRNGNVSKLFWAVHGIFNGIFPVGKNVNGKRKVVFAGTGKLRCRELKIAAQQAKKEVWDFDDGSQFSSAAASGPVLHSTRFVGHSLALPLGSGTNPKLFWVQGRIFDVKVIDGKRYFATDQGMKVFNAAGKLCGYVTGCCKRIVPVKSGIWAEVNGTMFLYSFRQQ
jgi:Concanavalin A-like lectin/glucanases superfamily